MLTVYFSLPAILLHQEGDERHKGFLQLLGVADGFEGEARGQDAVGRARVGHSCAGAVGLVVVLGVQVAPLCVIARAFEELNC